MASIASTSPTLPQIVARSREAARAREAALPLSELAARVPSAPAPRGFARALRAASASPAVIAEIKQASPSGGLLRADFDAEAIARTYAESGASGMSVLTEEAFFRGSRERLTRLREVVDLPLLQKDFVVTPYQLYEARCIGADAVLLIASILEDRALFELAHLATELGLDVLLEVHDEDELERALRVPSAMLGINNRNLKSYAIDLAVTEQLMARLGNRLGERLLVSESGIRTREDVARLRTAGARAVLVGEALMRKPDIARAYAELFGAT